MRPAGCRRVGRHMGWTVTLPLAVIPFDETMRELKSRGEWKLGRVLRLRVRHFSDGVVPGRGTT